MKNIVVLCTLLIVLAGCQNEFENASSNVQKGNSFFEEKEYDVAQYYYEKVPPESPLYPQAKAMLDSIAIFKQYWAMTTATEEDLKKILLFDHSGSVNYSKMTPLHSFVILNNTPRTLSKITVQFDYFDMDNNPVGQLICDVDAPVPTKKKGVFSRVEPGSLKSSFARSTAKLIGAGY